MRLQRSSTFAIGVFHCGRKMHKEDHRSKKSNGSFVRLADIYIFCCEGPVWIILLFKQLFICVHFYQLCQAEELL